MFKAYFRLVKWVFVGCCMVPVASAVCTLVNIINSGQEWSPAATGAKIALLAAAFAVPAGVGWWLLRRYHDRLDENANEQAAYLERIPQRNLSLAIFASAALMCLCHWWPPRAPACGLSTSAYSNVGWGLPRAANVGRDRVPPFLAGVSHVGRDHIPPFLKAT